MAAPPLHASPGNCGTPLGLGWHSPAGAHTRPAGLLGSILARPAALPSCTVGRCLCFCSALFGTRGHDATPASASALVPGVAARVCVGTHARRCPRPRGARPLAQRSGGVLPIAAPCLGHAPSGLLPEAALPERWRRRSTPPPLLWYARCHGAHCLFTRRLAYAGVGQPCAAATAAPLLAPLRPLALQRRLPSWYEGQSSGPAAPCAVAARGRTAPHAW